MRGQERRRDETRREEKKTKSKTNRMKKEGASVKGGGGREQVEEVEVGGNLVTLLWSRRQLLTLDRSQHSGKNSLSIRGQHSRHG